MEYNICYSKRNKNHSMEISLSLFTISEGWTLSVIRWSRMQYG